jgi:hypothetical protein
MSEREKMLEHLVKEVGISREEAERRMLDDDLWVLQSERRFAPEDEEAVEEWRKAVSSFWSLGGMTQWTGSGALSRWQCGTLWSGRR